MPKIELTYEQVLEAVAQLAADEQEQLAADLKARSPDSDYPPFMADDPLWNVIGMGQGTGESIALDHDDYLYGKND
jgi:hypothetical protein